MRMPTVFSSPLAALFQPYRTLFGGFVLGAIPEFGWHAKRLFAGIEYCSPIAARGVFAARFPFRMATSISPNSIPVTFWSFAIAMSLVSAPLGGFTGGEQVGLKVGP